MAWKLNTLLPCSWYWRRRKVQISWCFPLQTFLHALQKDSFMVFPSIQCVGSPVRIKTVILHYFGLQRFSNLSFLFCIIGPDGPGDYKPITGHNRCYNSEIQLWSHSGNCRLIFEYNPMISNWFVPAQGAQRPVCSQLNKQNLYINIKVKYLQ